VELAAAGARVTVLDVDADRASAVAASIGGVGLAVDVTDAAGVTTALAQAREAHGPARVLVNCAGLGARGMRTASPRGPYPLDVFEHVVAVNLFGSFNCARLAAADMVGLEPLQDGARGVIVHTASVNAMDGPVGTTAYSASKAAVVGMTLPMARDLAPYGIRVCTIAPGNFRTPMLEQIPAEGLALLQQEVPFPNTRFGDPSEFARLARHICENDMLNGETIRIDGAVRMSQH
jgi:NAD(P)-dependent dehydrogenase (short-subunit alcohol dehydrogenase family)